jgi:hypothetical protein
MKVYLLHHTNYIEEDEEDVKLIGAYSSFEKAQKAQSVVEKSPGFRDAKDGFSIDPYEIDATHWLEGFVTL